MTQRISLSNDIVSRSRKYLSDLSSCGAAWFAAGNSFFAYQSGSLGGFHLGGAWAGLLQLVAALFVFGGQVQATHRGGAYAVPFWRLGHVNLASAVVMIMVPFFSATGTSISSAMLPGVTLLLWATGEYQIAWVKDREEQLPAADARERAHLEKIIAAGYRRSIFLYGIADFAAVVSTAISIGRVLPAFGAAGAGLLFVSGIYRALTKRDDGSSAAEGARIPFLLYAAGYCVQATASIIAPLSVVCNLCWAKAYHSLTMVVSRESADEYAARQ
jgi:hypothetical protein